MPDGRVTLLTSSCSSVWRVRQRPFAFYTTGCYSHINDTCDLHTTMHTYYNQMYKSIFSFHYIAVRPYQSWIWNSVIEFVWWFWFKRSYAIPLCVNYFYEVLIYTTSSVIIFSDKSILSKIINIIIKLIIMRF